MNQDHALFGRTLDEIERDEELAWESDDYSYDEREHDNDAEDEFIDSAMDYLTHEHPEVPF
jgi:hypothetical protein